MIEDNKNLIPLGNGSLPAIIERRTQIANRVLGQLSSDQTEAFFQKYPEFFRLVACCYYPLDEEIIEHYADYLDWERLSSNTALPWSIDLIPEVTAELLRTGGDGRSLRLYGDLAGLIEESADALSNSALMLRDHVLGEVLAL